MLRSSPFTLLSLLSLLLILFALSWIPAASALYQCSRMDCDGWDCDQYDPYDPLGYECGCPGPYTGHGCRTYDYCKKTPCDFYCTERHCDHGYCVSLPLESNYTCVCSKGWRGRDCELVDNCYPNPCGNGTCTNSEVDLEAHSCSCHPHYSGEACEIYHPCSPNPCDPGSCTDLGDGTANCTCPEHYLGKFCDPDPCHFGLCGNGTCNSEGVCICNPGYKGLYCDIRNCEINPCQQGGACTETPNGFSCNCSGTGYLGTTCQTLGPPHYCRRNYPCRNGGICKDNDSDVSYTCDCTGTGYTGLNCMHHFACTATVEANAFWNITNFGNYAWGVCDEGFVGAPFRQCFVQGLFGPISNPCVNASLECPSEIFGNAWWSGTVFTTVTGICLPGYEGAPLMKCRVDGTWERQLDGFCTKRQCPAGPDGNAMWLQKPAGAVTIGVCDEGFNGRPIRTCLDTGIYGPITNPCVENGIECAGEIYGNADWPTTPVGQTANGTCQPGYTGSPSRFCQLPGTWSASLVNFCSRTPCPPVVEENAEWQVTNQGALAYGTCAPGYIGTPKRLCNSAGAWEEIIDPCQSQGNCPGELYARANWAETAPGETAVGECISGWNGAPVRICKTNGLWQDLVNNHCQRD